MKTALVSSLLLMAACGTSPSALESAPKQTQEANGAEKPNSRDCSEAYGGQAASCKVVECLPQYKEFIGTWKGPFEAYDQELQAFRPYENEITYSTVDCLENIDNGDVFIIGRRTDTYPEFRGKASVVKTGLLITGVDAARKPFLKTKDDEGVYSYNLQYKSNAASMSVWSLTVHPDNSDPMTFTTVDGRDWTAPEAHKRNVVVTMSLGPQESPVWEGVIVRGYHTLQEK